MVKMCLFMPQKCLTSTRRNQGCKRFLDMYWICTNRHRGECIHYLNGSSMVRIRDNRRWGVKGDIGWSNRVLEMSGMEEDVRMFWYLIYLCNRQEEDCVCVCASLRWWKKGLVHRYKTLFCSYSWKDTLIFNAFNHQHLNKGLWTENKRSYVIFWWSQIAFYLLYVCSQCWERLQNVSEETFS